MNTTERPPISVLLVDDSDVFRRAARTVVHSTPEFAVAGEAITGEDAVRLAGALRPKLVLMDINLPVVDGIEATRRIVMTPPSPVVVLMSTYPANDLPPGVHTCGAERYVHKQHFGPDELRQIWFETHRPATSRRHTA